MAKSKSKVKVKKAPRRAPVNRLMRKGLDSQALAWARLLSDPCGSPLAHPCYVGSDGGILTRFEGFYDVGTGATDTCGIFSYTPNAVGNITATGLGPAISFFNAANPGVATSLVNPTSGSQPGYTFLSGNATAVRCVSACIQVFYAGTELNRSGIISYGNVSGGTFQVGSSVNVNNSSNVLEHYCRVPNEIIEIKWRPTSADQLWRDPSQAIGSFNDLARLGGMGFTFTGLQAAAGLRVRLVAIYEYIPDAQVGITNTAQSRNTSGNSFDDVINFLDSSGDWMTRASVAAGSLYRGARRIEPYVRAVAYGGSRVAGMLM